MGAPRDTTELLHTILAELDHDVVDPAQVPTMLRTLVAVVDSLDQRLKNLEEDSR